MNHPAYCSEPFMVKVVKYIESELRVEAVDPTKNEAITYSLFLPAYFGGPEAPYPKVGETICIVYNQLQKHVVEAWHPKQQVTT